ncbi:hypothetical protein ACVW5Z_000661 [Escherichia coli]
MSKYEELEAKGMALVEKRNKATGSQREMLNKEIKAIRQAQIKALKDGIVEAFNLAIPVLVEKAIKESGVQKQLKSCAEVNEMDEQIKALLNQVRILEEEANKHTGNKREELFKAAGRIKNQVATLLNQQGKGRAESKVPDPNEYFGSKLPEGFGDYFSGDYLTDEQRDYFNNLTPEQRDYFEVKAPDNMPEARQSTETPKSYEMDADLRRRILNAIGIPC